MWGLNFTMSCSIKMYLNKFKVDISSLPRKSPYARDDPYAVVSQHDATRLHTT